MPACAKFWERSSCACFGLPIARYTGCSPSCTHVPSLVTSAPYAALMRPSPLALPTRGITLIVTSLGVDARKHYRCQLLAQMISDVHVEFSSVDLALPEWRAARADIARLVDAAIRHTEVAAGLRFNLCSKPGPPTPDSGLVALLKSARRPWEK